MDTMKPISRRGFVKNSVMGGVAAMAALGLPSGRDLAASSESPEGRMRFGANYLPRKRWWYCWQDWDQQGIVDDLSGVASLGLDHIRIQCLWPMFQPGISSISDSVLENLGKLLDAADQTGLDVEVTVLNGWMSGLQFLPPWVAPLKVPAGDVDGNMFTDREVIEAEKLLFRRLGKTVAQHRRFMGFDIGNELSVLQLFQNPATPKQADAWATEIFAECEKVAPGKFHVNGVDDTNWFTDFGFTRGNLANTGQATVVHCYVYFTDALKRYKYSGVGSLHLAEYMVELAYAYQNNLRRPVWVEEVGTSAEWMPQSYLTEFMQHTVMNVARTGKCWGVTWWGSHDIDPAIKGFHPLEYTLGLLDLQNKPKPLGREFAKLAKQLRSRPPEILPRPLGLVIPDYGLSTKPHPPDWRYATPYMNLVAQGKRPAIVLESRAHDEQYLKARGIRELIPLAKVKA